MSHVYVRYRLTMYYSSALRIMNTPAILARFWVGFVRTTSPPIQQRPNSEVEYVGHLITSTGTSFTEEKRLQVLDFPLPETEKALLQFIELVNYFRDHVPKMTEMVQPLRKLMDMKKYKGSKKLTWTDEAIEAFHYCRVAVSNCQELYFLEDTVTPILQTDASDYGIGGYLYMIVNHQVRVIRFFSKYLVGSQLNWSTREKECYSIYYGVKLSFATTPSLAACTIQATIILL